MKVCILYNPLSGSGKGKEEASIISLLFNGEIIIKDITEIDDYKSFLCNITRDDLLVLCGGDGTINRFVNDTDGIDIPCDILYHACGTGNDFLLDLGKKVDEKPFSIKKYITDLPCVYVKGKTYRFLNNVGFGIDGYCCEVGDKLKEKSDKPVNYTAIAIKGLLGGFKPTGALVTVDGNIYRYEKVWLAPTMKGRYYGGGMMAVPDQNRCDPEKALSIMLFHGKGKLKTLMAFPKIFKGEHVKHTDMVAVHKGKNISVIFDRPCALQIDGETILDVTEYHAYVPLSEESLAKTSLAPQF